jgi:hypothetical protein
MTLIAVEVLLSTDQMYYGEELLIIVASKYNIQIHVCKRTERSGE